MDCEKLRLDIEQLREARDAFKSAADETIETGLGKTKCNERLKQASEIEDQVLANYLEKFAEKNRDIFIYEYGEAIYDCGRPVNAFLELDNGDVVMACGDFTNVAAAQKRGSDAVIVILRKQEDGSYKHVENLIAPIGKISCMEQADDSTIFYGGEETGIIQIGKDGRYSVDPFGSQRSADDEIKKMPNGDVIALHHGVPTIIRKNSSGDGVEHETISSIENSSGETFSAILPLSDTELLLSGSYLNFINKDDDGVYRQFGAIEGTGGYDSLLTLLNNGDILVAGGEKESENCDLRIAHKGRFGYELGESIFSTSDGYPRAVLQLPNGNIVITVDNPSTDRSYLQILRRRDDGSYDASDEIDCGSGSEAGSLSYKLKDGRVLCDADWGKICFLQDSAPDLEKMKSKLGQIAARGETSLDF